LCSAQDSATLRTAALTQDSAALRTLQRSGLCNAQDSAALTQDSAALTQDSAALTQDSA
ncbi:hypothetical protein P7K49_027828, partial [Saguinus oedipus]